MMSRSDSAVAAEEPLFLNPLPPQLGTRQSRSEFALSSLLLVIVLAIVSTVVVLGIRRSGDFALDDEARHAMTGAYFADLLSDLPLSHPIQYTYAYYARYPTLGLIHWPPLFPFVEGLAFLALGPSIVVARLTVLVFVAWGLIFWFLLVRELFTFLGGCVRDAGLILPSGTVFVPAGPSCWKYHLWHYVCRPPISGCASCELATTVLSTPSPGGFPGDAHEAAVRVSVAVLLANLASQWQVASATDHPRSGNCSFFRNDAGPLGHPSHQDAPGQHR